MIRQILFISFLLYVGPSRCALHEPLQIIGIKNNLAEPIILKVFKNDDFQTQQSFYVGPSESQKTKAALSIFEKISIESARCIKTIEFNELKYIGNDVAKKIFLEIDASNEGSKSLISLLFKTAVNKFSLRFIVGYEQLQKSLDETCIKKMIVTHR